MVDESNLVSLINERFDDLNARIDDLKRDMVRRHEAHEHEDKERFAQISAEVEPLKHMKRSVAGSAGVAVIVIQAMAEVLKTYFTK